MIRREALDGAARRRLYLFRHGAVDYVDAHGRWVEDPDRVSLNARGRRQAQAMAELFADVVVDRAVCSGLPRTRETAETVLGDRALELEVMVEFEEIRAARPDSAGAIDVFADVAFAHWRAPHGDARFLGGEPYADFYERISRAMQGLLADASWHNCAVFAHGGTNAAALGWATGIGLKAFGLIDQAMCCLNVIDFDVDAGGSVVRTAVRALNVTAEDPVKHKRHAGDMEMLARRIMKHSGKSG